MTGGRARSAVLGVLLPWLGFTPLMAAPAQEQGVVTTSVPYTDARPLFELLRRELLPEAVRDLGPSDRERQWLNWVARRDLEIRSRVARGNEDSLVNLLVYGTAFTHQARFRYTDIPYLLEDANGVALLHRRIDDLALALASPGANDRLHFARDVIKGAGIDPDTEERRVREYLLDITRRAVDDRRRYDEADAAAKRMDDPNAGLIGRGTLYRDRGLATDTSLFPDHALEEALKDVQSERLLEDGTVRRVAIIGPGLDFVDKQDGYDFYPVQTIQPYAVMESLQRLGIATARDLRITAIDINPRVAQHLGLARQRAAAGESHLVWLPRDVEEQWTPALVRFWERVGDTIGQEAQVPEPASMPRNVRVRAVHIRPEAILRTTPRGLNIVLQRLDLGIEARFDLVIATNTLVYYDVFDQLLALANIAAMLRPGGIFLSNNLVVPNEPMVLAGYTDVPYTQSGDGDRIFWYQRR